VRRPRRAPEDSLTVFVISTGEDVKDECLAALGRQTRSFRLKAIEDVYPMSAAFQAMPDRCETPYFLQVDADMVLEPHAVETLHDAVIGAGPRTYMVAGQLYEEGFGIGGACKCWKRSLFRFFRFRDVRTVDRDLYRRTRRLGLARRLLEEPVGTHRSRHSSESEWLKAKGDVEKWRFLGRDPSAYAAPLVEELLAAYPEDSQRLLGALLGALTTEPRLSRSKDIRYERALREEVLALLTLPSPADPALTAEQRSDIAHRFCEAYAGGSRESLAEVVADAFGGDGANSDELLRQTSA
jgi:hypothetical protein